MNYILAEQKTEKGALVTSFHCNVGSLAPDFLDVREASGTKGNVLAHQIIQSFAIGEVSKEKAHEIGVALCDALLKGEYQYVISTHVDKKHVHNHIIFNAVNEKTRRCYRSTPKRYFQEIREKSDALCRENGLSVIDPYPEKYEKHFKKEACHILNGCEDKRQTRAQELHGTLIVSREVLRTGRRSLKQ